MTPSRPWSRRRLLRSLLGLSAGWAALGALHPGAAFAAACARTPAQTEGPFYPPQFGAPGADLVIAGPGGALPKGEVIAIAGRVTDAQCRPVPGAVVEIWQADSNGRYAHPHESRAGERDPLFRYWGRATADADGTYRFRTIRPAPYKAGWSWRAPHVHFKVYHSGALRLTTQMYFAGEALNAKDSIVRSLSEAQRAAVTVTPQPPAGAADGSAVYRFDIALA